MGGPFAGVLDSVRMVWHGARACAVAQVACTVFVGALPIGTAGMVAVGAAGTALLISLLALVARRTLAAVTVYGRSMAPSYLEGDRLLVRRKTVTGLRRGQVVVVRGPDPDKNRAELKRWMIKRVAAPPGDPVPPEVAAALAGRPHVTVPAGMLVLLGDNPSVSFDSRQFGYFPAEWLLGVAVRRLNRTTLPALRPSTSPTPAVLGHSSVTSGHPRARRTRT